MVACVFLARVAAAYECIGVRVFLRLLSNLLRKESISMKRRGEGGAGRREGGGEVEEKRARKNEHEEGEIEGEEGAVVAPGVLAGEGTGGTGGAGDAEGGGKDVDVAPPPSAAAAAVAKGAQDRNRRMFGSLLSHLGKAKQAIAKDSKTIETRQTIVETASKRNTLDGKIKAIEGTVKDIKKSNDKWVDEMEARSNLFLTQCSPHITWLPATHNDVTRKMLAEKKDKFELELEERRRGDAAKVAELEAKKKVMAVKRVPTMG